MQKLLLIAFVAGVCIAQQPPAPVVKCPLGATSCGFGDKGIIKVTSCLKSVKQADEQGNESCNFNFVLDWNAILTTSLMWRKDINDPIRFIVDRC